MSTATEHLDAERPAAATTLPPVRASSWFITVLVVPALLIGVVFGTWRLAFVWGVDLRAPWRSSPPSVSMNRIDGGAARSQTAASATVATSVASRAATNASLRDQPPTVSSGLPKFSVRDGETYGFVTDLDAETLRRLDALEGEVREGLTYTRQMGEAVQRVTALLNQRLAALDGNQAAFGAELSTMKSELTAVLGAVRDVGARVSRYAGDNPTAAPSGQSIKGWEITALTGSRAWVKAPSGEVITVVEGEPIKNLGAVRHVDGSRQIVVLDDGRYIR